MKKFYILLLALTFSLPTIANYQNLVFNGKSYSPQKANTNYLTQEKLLKKIDLANKYDIDITKQFESNKELVPFNDLSDEYFKVFKNNDSLLLEILNGNYNSEVLNAYQSYYNNMIKNFKKNIEFFKERDGHKTMLSNLNTMLNKLMVQQDGQMQFFNQLKKLEAEVD